MERCRPKPRIQRAITCLPPNSHLKIDQVISLRINHLPPLDIHTATPLPNRATNHLKIQHRLVQKWNSPKVSTLSKKSENRRSSSQGQIKWKRSTRCRRKSSKPWSRTWSRRTRSPINRTFSPPNKMCRTNEYISVRLNPPLSIHSHVHR